MERLSALAGVLAVVLWGVGVAIIGGGHVGLPGGVPEEGADEVLLHFRENEDGVVSGGWLFMLGSLAFLWFAGILRGHLLRAEGGTGTFASIAFAGAWPRASSRSASPPAASWLLSASIRSGRRRRRR